MDLVLHGVTLPDGTTTTLRAVAGVIVPPGPDEHPATTGHWDATGLVALPRLVDAHVHLDKTLLGSRWYPHREVASLADRIEAEIALLEGGEVEPVEVRARRLVELALANGATALQSHVDVSGRVGLTRLEPLLALREEQRGRVDIRLVAFPQEGVLRAAGTASALEAAVREGCDAVGGLDPAEFDGDRDSQLDTVFAIADRHGCRVDIHLHESGKTGLASLEAIADRTRALGLAGRVCVSHAYALAQVPQAVAAATGESLAEAGVGLVSSAPGEGRMPPLSFLAGLGVRVAVASDNIRDSWWPYGKADPLERACTAGYLVGAHDDASIAQMLAMVTTTPAELLGLPLATLAPGDVADFTLVPASSAAEAVVAQPASRVVVRGGRIVAGADLLDRRVCHNTAIVA